MRAPPDETSPRRRTSRVVAALFACVIVSRVPLEATGIDFDRDVRPILSDNCFHCHGPDPSSREGGAKREEGVRLDTREGLLADLGDGRAVVRPGDPAQSELMKRVLHADPTERMPPPSSRRELTPLQIATLERWITAGAKWKQHWAFEPPQRPDLPPVKNVEWPRGAIDRFVLAGLELKGWAPSPPASKELLLRRVTLDLTGVPPTLEELDRFLADSSPSAYENVVDALLASSRYGERMAWDWLDAARYADSNGFQGDAERTMWPWRDWVVRAINEGMSFDRFTIEQLAGDLLPEATLEQHVATGFNRNHMFNAEGGRIAEETRVENVFDRVETTATVWLGLTFTCARCHDHKFDPITQREYFEMYAFFNNTSENGSGGRSPGGVAPTVNWLSPERRAKKAEAERMIVELAQALESLEKAAFGDGGKLSDDKLPENVRKALGSTPRDRSGDRLKDIREHVVNLVGVDGAYVAALEKLETRVREREAIARSATKVMVMDERSKKRTSHILVRGAYNKKGERVEESVPSVLPSLPDGAPRHRLTLAEWIVSREHPLTARVTVNRAWQTFFGTGLVATPEDFGSQGEKPSHPDLLDWLAVEFMDSGWNTKALHKKIVMSATYRQSARVSAEAVERDPDNRYLSRGPRFRMPSWMLRDQALFVSGLLVEKLGGPSVNPYQPPGVWAEATFGKKRYSRGKGDDLYRRSLYTFWRRIIGPTMFFDAGKRQTCTVQSSRTNTPLHALATLNDVTYVEAARALAQRVLQSGGASDRARLATAFRMATSRQPAAAEVDVLSARLVHLREHYRADSVAAEALLTFGDSPRDNTLEAAEHAAWTCITSILLNLDETLTN